MTDNTALVESFFAGLSNANLPESLFTADARASTTTSGWMDIARYCAASGIFKAVFENGLHFQILSVTAQHDRVAVEARSSGRFRDGVDYTNDYVFMFHISDGRIATVAEHFDPRPVQELLAPRIQQMMAQKANA